ncbi:MAG: response regulator [Planctomycetaceae bacterium]|nr:response regulator [Planctomycetaceae bacterium]
MSPTILIADDDRESAMLYEHYLNRCGYRVLSASGGVECLPIIREESPTVIVASVSMPWGGADGLLDCLSEESELQCGPNVILTGYTADENVTALCEMPGVFRYLRKPFLMGRLLDYVRAIEFDLRDASRPNWSPRNRPSPVACH